MGELIRVQERWFYDNKDRVKKIWWCEWKDLQSEWIDDGDWRWRMLGGGEVTVTASIFFIYFLIWWLCETERNEFTDNEIYCFFFILSKRKSPKTTLNLLFYYNIKIIIKYRLYYFIKTNIKINQLRLSSTHLLGMIDSVKWKILYKYTS